MGQQQKGPAHSLLAHPSTTLHYHCLGSGAGSIQVAQGSKGTPWSPTLHIDTHIHMLHTHTYAHTHRLLLTCTTHTRIPQTCTHHRSTCYCLLYLCLPMVFLDVILGKKNLKILAQNRKATPYNQGRGGRNIHARTPMPRIAQPSLIHLCSWRTAGTVCQAGKRSWEGSNQILTGNAMIQ